MRRRPAHGAPRSARWLSDLLVREVWAVWLGALVLELASRSLVEASGQRLQHRIEATLFALALGAQVCAALGLLPFRLALARLTGRFRLLVSFAAALAAAVLVRPSAVALTSGAFISAQTYVEALRLGMMAAAGLAASALVYLGIDVCARATARVRFAISGVALVLSLAGTFAHLELYPGQYPEGHLVLVASAAFCAQVGMAALLHALAPARAGRALRIAALPLAAAAAFGLVSLLPPSKPTTARLLLHEPRVRPLLSVLPKPEGNEIAHELRVLDPDDPFVPRRVERPRAALPSDFNFLLVVIDSLRADALPPLVDEPERTRFRRSDAPFLSELADRSVRFLRAYTGATYTYRAMPAMFDSRRPLGSKRRRGALGVLMAEQGRTPVAVVNDFFAQPIDRNIARLLDGFVDLRMYDETEQQRQRGLVRGVLERVKDGPFFAWLHYYGVHWPGWDGKAIPRASKRWPKNYPRGLRWVDGEIRWLFGQLERLGIADRTVVAVTADHGEGLMDTGHMYHGPVVYEEAVRVPLFIYVPNAPGRIVERTVGTIDLVPTLLELAGGAPRLSHEGESLVPLFSPEGAEPEGPGDEPYFFVSGTERQIGVVRGSDKHVFDRKTGVHMHFDLDADPFEERDVFDERDPAHRALLGELVREFPQVFEPTLSPLAARLLDEHLARIAPARPPAKLRFLLRLIALAPNEARLAWARRVFEAAESDEIRLLVLDELYEHDAERLGALLGHHLGAKEGAAEIALVNALADLGIGPFARELVTERIVQRLAGDVAEWFPWLRLISEWPHAGARQIAVLQTLAARCSNEASPCDELVIRVLLRAISNAELRSAGHGPIGKALVGWLDHPSLGVQQDAARALGHTQLPEAERLLRARLVARPLNVRLGALEGLTALLGGRALGDIRALSADPEFQATCVRLAVSLGTRDALAFLEGLRDRTKSRFVRANARRAVKELRARLAPP